MTGELIRQGVLRISQVCSVTGELIRQVPNVLC